MAHLTSGNGYSNGYAKLAERRDLEFWTRAGWDTNSLTLAECAEIVGDNVVLLHPCLMAALRYVKDSSWSSFPADTEWNEDTKKFNKKSYLKAEFAPGGENWGMTTDVEQLKRNFNNPKWRHKCGIGIPTGIENSIFVIEADTLKGHDVDGISSLRELEKKHGTLPMTLMAMSPSGSIHRYYRHPGDGIKVVSSTIAPGVDVKGDGGMVVAPPSVRGDGVYVWLNDLPIAVAPQWLLDLITEPVRPTRVNGGAGNVYGEFHQQKFKAPPARVARMLAAISIEPHDRWEKGKRDWYVMIGHAVKGATDGSVDGLRLFCEWRRQADGYDEQTVISKWLSFQPNEIGAGTLVHWASEFDPNWEKQKPASDPLSEAGEHNRGLKEAKTKLLQTTAEFVAGFAPPDYLIDGLLQRRYLYALTGPTGSGKTGIGLRIAGHVALGLPLAGRQVEKGRVLFLAGENDTDIRIRWIKQCQELGVKDWQIDVVFMPFRQDLSDKEFLAQIKAEAAEHGDFSLVIIDSSAAYNTGNDENDNVQLGEHARTLRKLINELPGGPTGLVLCHPTKTYNIDNLLPRGAGAFLAEIDGNLVCIKQSGSMVVEITWHGKFRGPDFKPFAFKLKPGQSDQLFDSKGRNLWTVTAEPISDEEQEEIEKASDRNQDELLRTMFDYPGLSIRALAEKLRWITTHGEPNKHHVNDMLKALTKLKLTELGPNGRYYTLTAKGQEVAEQLPKVHYIEVTPVGFHEGKLRAL
jgi:hypothetical protein